MDTPHETASECYNMSRRRSGRREVGIGIGHHRVGIGIGRHEVGIGIGKIYFSATINNYKKHLSILKDDRCPIVS